jgi:hypothetical protein
VLLTGTLASAQSASTKSSLSGIVVDSGGGVIPGATVVVKNNATGVAINTVTNSAGAFSVPALDIGTYTVTVSLTGFKTFVITDVAVIVGSPAAVRATLEVGTLTETVEVRAGTELVQTQATSVSSTISAAQIQSLPLTSRNALFGFVITLPGVDVAAGSSPRDSQLFGLPEQAINITIDGVNSQNNFQRSTDGFYSMVFPQLDALEQVTLTGAAAGAESASGGSVAIRFVTRSGTNNYQGSGYYYFRHPALNTNYYFNEISGLGKNQLKLNQFGGRYGGPIKIPGLFDGTGKAFFFFNYEEFRQPTSATRTRTLLNPLAQSGVFSYSTSAGVRQVNLLQLAQTNGQIASFDPTVAALLAQIRSLADGTVPQGIGVITDNTTNTQQLLYQAPGNYINHLPTTKVDINLSQNNKLSGSYWWQEVNRFPDIQNGGEATFPGLPNVANYTSIRTVGSVTLRSTFSSNLVNELLGGWQWSPGTFNSGVVASMFENQRMHSLGFPLGTTAATRSTNPNSRYQDNWNINDTVSWLKGNHNFSFGGGFNSVGQYNTAQVVVPTISFGIQTGLDPADAMFSTTNFPGASNTNLTDARALYAFLTGRVTQVGGTANLNESTGRYEYLGRADQRARMDEYNLFAQDSWRIRQNVTLNYGAAWVVQMPMKAGNDVFSTTDFAGFCGPYGIGSDGRCKLFQVGGEQTGVTPQFVQYSQGTRGYNIDWNNVAPNVGVAWRPNVQEGWLRTMLGDPESATVRAGYSITFDKPNMGDFFGVYGGNPGRTYNANRNNSTGSNHLLVFPGESWPVLYRDASRLAPPTGIPDGPVYPIAATTGSSLAIFDPNIEVPFTHSMSFGVQRALTKDMAVEVRYVGTRGRKGWVTENWNETNIIENGFFEEFKLAQANLRAHLAAGCTTSGANACSFAYRGPGTGTSPLPIYLAYLQGLPASQAGNAASYLASNFTNTTFVGRLNPYSPSPTGAAGDLQTTARIANGLAAGLPANFFRMNPAVGTNNVNQTTGVGETRYDSVVVELRRRMSRGLFVNGSFTRAWRWGQTRDSLHVDRVFIRSTNEVPWALKVTANYEVPVGRGKRFGPDMNSWLNGVIGDWTVNFVGRVQSGRVGSLGSVRLVGMSLDDLQKEFYIRITDIVDANGRPTKMVRILPDDIILNTRRAFDTSATSPTGYGSLGPPEGRYIAPASGPDCLQLYPGDCAPRQNILIGPVFSRFDLSAKKRFPIGGRKSFDVEVSVLNLFEAINFNPVFTPGSGENIFRVTSAYTDISQSYDPGGRLMQLVWRINW